MMYKKSVDKIESRNSQGKLIKLKHDEKEYV